jgi:hypothetical protein
MSKVPSSERSSRWSSHGLGFLSLILLLGLGLRIISVSSPYFVDGPAHVHAIETGTLFIQPPGYFLFNWCGLFISRITDLSAARAVIVMNISFSEVGLVCFALLSRRRLRELDALFITACFAVSPMLWFIADIHSTYAAMSFFAPLLFLSFEEWNSIELGTVFWALMMGFRPSDGVFALPWVVWQSLRYPWFSRLRGMICALLGVSLWWIPTARHFGSLLAPIISSRTQVRGLAHGVLAGQHSAHALLDQVRVLTGMLLGWGLLLPFACWAISVCSWRSRPLFSILLWTLPGLGFFCLYYVADPVYVAYFLGPGLLAAALWLSMKGIRLRIPLYLVSTTVCLVYMLTAQPVSGTSKVVPVLNAYLFKFSCWSLQHRYAPRLATLVGACGQTGVQGLCDVSTPP